ncbi:MAG: hypothetical protein M3T56_18325, partial [Chloroflexota bacterium]|nr:hypothetical protein [Chloroflexota bacterium]
MPRNDTSRMSRREALKLLGIGAGGLIVGCGGGTGPSAATSTPTASPSGLAGFPSYYPASYAQIIEAAKTEPKLQVYSIMSKTNWQPVIDAFKAKF